MRFNYVSQLLAYCFPPFAIIFKCLEKIRREKALVVFVCPVWIGQPWFPFLLELSCDVPRLLPPSQHLLKSALDETHPLIRNGALHLAVWRLSGDSTLSEGFSATVVDLLMAGNRPSTHSTYESTWRKWMDLCLGKRSNHFFFFFLKIRGAGARPKARKITSIISVICFEVIYSRVPAVLLSLHLERECVPRIFPGIC